MSNIQCTTCKQHKKQEHFTTKMLSSETPMCNVCDLKVLQRRLAGFNDQIVSLKKQQKAVKEVSKIIGESSRSTPTKKQTANSFLRTILQNAHS